MWLDVFGFCRPIAGLLSALQRRRWRSGLALIFAPTVCQGRIRRAGKRCRVRPVQHRMPLRKSSTGAGQSALGHDEMPHQARAEKQSQYKVSDHHEAWIPERSAAALTRYPPVPEVIQSNCVTPLELPSVQSVPVNTAPNCYKKFFVP